MLEQKLYQTVIMEYFASDIHNSTVNFEQLYAKVC